MGKKRTELSNKPAERSNKRKKDTREQKVILIVCLGQCTEKTYFESFETDEAQVVVTATHKSPSHLIGYAQRYIKTNPRKYIDVWLVFDQDNFKKDGDISKAFQKAKAARFKIAYSVKQFEHWLLLHFGPYSDLMLKEDYQTKLDVHWNELFKRPYQKEKLTQEECKQLDRAQLTAIKNAQCLKAGGDPSSTVWQLVEILRELRPPNSPPC